MEAEVETASDVYVKEVANTSSHDADISLIEGRTEQFDVAVTGLEQKFTAWKKSSGSEINAFTS
eukprot:5226685-Lingulodinium_polyedra.AAC.1